MSAQQTINRVIIFYKDCNFGYNKHNQLLFQPNVLFLFFISPSYHGIQDLISIFYKQKLDTHQIQETIQELIHIFN